MGSSSLVVDGYIGDDLREARRQANWDGTIEGWHYSRYLTDVQDFVEQQRKDDAVRLLVRIAVAAESESRGNRGLTLDPTGYTALLFLLWDMGRERDAAVVMASFSSQPLAA